MTDCEMCGKKLQVAQKAKIEGTIMNVCSKCAQYGEVLVKPTTTFAKKGFSQTKHREKENPDNDRMIVKQYGARIKEAREKRKLKQEEFAKQINEKESLIHKVESEHIHLSFRLARKLEKFLGIQLIEKIPEAREQFENKQSEDSGELTMGDILKKALEKKK